MLPVKFLWFKYLLCFECLFDDDVYTSQKHFPSQSAVFCWHLVTLVRNAVIDLDKHFFQMVSSMITFDDICQGLKESKTFSALTLECNKQKFGLFYPMLTCSLPLRRAVIVAIIIILKLLKGCCLHASQSRPWTDSTVSLTCNTSLLQSHNFVLIPIIFC